MPFSQLVCLGEGFNSKTHRRARRAQAIAYPARWQICQLWHPTKSVYPGTSKPGPKGFDLPETSFKASVIGVPRAKVIQLPEFPAGRERGSFDHGFSLLRALDIIEAPANNATVI